ncbi:hypothetical protein EJB05_22746, partial [Eragrostis curvula]
MPLSFSLCGGKPSRSASAIVVDSARGRHDLSIDAMSFAAGALAPTGRFVNSSAFTVGGHRWRINYFPNGDCADSAGHVSLFLALDEEDVAGEVTAVFQFTLVAETRAAFFVRRRKKVKSLPPITNHFSNQQKTLADPEIVQWAFKL